MATIPVNDLKRVDDDVAAAVEAAVLRVLARGWFVLGPECEAFESAFAEYCGVEHCVGVGNGTDALELALRAVGVAAGDRVVAAANAGYYAPTAIRSLGAVPVYADVEWDSMTLDPRALGPALELGPKAIVVTHLYGRVADTDAVVALAAERGIAVVEDCAQAHGATLGGRRVGAAGDVGCYSFYPTKNLGAVGDGGAVVTRRGDVAERVRALRQYGWTSKYRSEVAGGRNSRLDEVQAAALLAKLSHLDAWNRRRVEIARAYSEGLAGLDLVVPDAGAPGYVAHLYVVRTPERDALRAALAARGVASDVHYPVPDHRQASADVFEVAGGALPVSERCCAEVLTLPCFPGLTDDEVERVVSAVRDALGDAPGRR